MTLNEARAYARNKGAFDNGDTWLVINSATGIALESHPNQTRAQIAAGWCNEHEERNNREPTYYAAKVTS